MSSAEAVAAPVAGSLDDLQGQTCRGLCGRDTPRVADAALPRYLSLLPAWTLSKDKTSISRSFTARNFMAAVNFLNEVAALAEAEGHHPDLHLTTYRTVMLVCSTHAVKGLALPDFILASKIDRLPVDYSPKWLENQLAAGGAAPGAAQPEVAAEAGAVPT